MVARRDFLKISGRFAAGAAAAMLVGCSDRNPAARSKRMHEATAPVTLFLCGDVMAGRAIDQILSHPSDPRLHEPYVNDAREYLALAERASGAIPRPAPFDYIWGALLPELAKRQPQARIVNLETSVTRSDNWWRGKGIHYRMHPGNAACLTAAAIDCCVLANNHVLDWGYDGLADTLATLHAIGIRTTGAGSDLAQASAPAVLPLSAWHRLLVFSAATEDSGVSGAWTAGSQRPGVHRLPDLSMSTVEALAANVGAHRRDGDRVLYSLHWGGNWGFEVTAAQRAFAHALIDVAGVDVVHGHSSHHVKAIEVHRGRPILHGCGDFIDDYEGIGGHEEYRGELGAMYFVTLDAADGRLLALDLVPTRTRRFRIEHARANDRAWLLRTLRRECAAFGCELDDRNAEGFALQWSG
jgi:poly-gamma-glutamate capsule biosynthesis protein CapA/YwtB (metallophosphatase superfamily)